MPNPPRPSSFDVSFPNEARARMALAMASGSAPGQAAESSSQHKRGRATEQLPQVKRPRDVSPKNPIYKRSPGEVDEDNRALRAIDMQSEDIREGIICRNLSGFCFFDPAKGDKMVSLRFVGQCKNLAIAASGVVSAAYQDEEDEGQEDDDDDTSATPLVVRLGAIKAMHVDYEAYPHPVWLQTEKSWYMLNQPSKQYRSLWNDFYAPLHLAQLAISSLPDEDFDAFRNRAGCNDASIRAAVPHISWFLQDQEENTRTQKLSCPVLRHLHSKYTIWSPQSTAPPRLKPPVFQTSIGSADLAVLKKDRQQPTHVTPRVDYLAKGLYKEQFVVIGSPENRDEIEASWKKRYERVRKLVASVHAHPKRSYQVVRCKRGSEYATEIQIAGVTYSVGDVVAIRIGAVENKEDSSAPALPTERQVHKRAVLGDYFWIAKLIWIHPSTGMCHLQWFEDGYHTLLEELADPHELFVMEMCSDMELKFIDGKVDARHWANWKKPFSKTELAKMDYFYRFLYQPSMGSWAEIPPEMISPNPKSKPPNNCHVCDLFVARKERTDALNVVSKTDGIWFNGQRYHCGDYVLYQTDDQGPCSIGMIVDFLYTTSTRREVEKINLRCLGRVSDIRNLWPASTRPLKDERHLFLTDEIEPVPDMSLFRKCYVATPMRPDQFHDPEWLTYPDHFYADWIFPSRFVESLHGKRDLVPGSFDQECEPCWKADVERTTSIRNFTKTRHKKRGMDLFGGVGGLGLGVQLGSDCFEIQDAIEISPSACQTYKLNSPNTRVHNQCSNLILNALIKTCQNRKVGTLQAHNNTKIDVDSLPRPGQLGLMTVGFPCQPHSGLAQFQELEEQKANLILNALSWVDFERPIFIIFENVRGFLSSKLEAQDNSIHRVNPGEIAMGQLKLVIRALLDFGYQLRISLLQAAHYGLPQARVRFFLIGALRGHPLPDFPQPTHDFPLVDALSVKSPMGDVQPIWTQNGTAPFPFVPVEDAIGDLYRFDWADPTKPNERPRVLPSGQKVPLVPCIKSNWYSGYSGDHLEYQHEAQTTYQKRARKVPTTDIQHYTRIFIPRKVQQVRSVPIERGADYRSIPQNLADWEFSNPSSAIGRGGFRTGYFRRLEQEGWFNTVVTNVGPTAKQSKVLHPTCKRIVTVRELARSQGFPDNFVFESINNDVVMMHRQIGNAVPLPLAMAIGYKFKEALWKQSEEEIVVID